VGILEISFYGPFAYFVNPNRQFLDIYAPKCPGHRASISSPVHQLPIRGRSCNGKTYSYSLRSKGITPGKGKFDGSTRILRTKSSLSAKADPFFRLTVPTPSLIHGIHSDRVEVITSGSPTGQLSDTATSLRFYYIFDMASPIEFWCPLATSGLHLGFIQPQLPGSGKISHADITVRFENSQEEDVDKTDAQDCFLRLRDMLGLKWWVSYDEKNANPQLEVRSGVDCRAPIIVSE